MSKTKKLKVVKREVKEAAKELLKLFGAKGQHWIAGNETDDEGGFCLIGGLEHLGYKRSLLDKNLPLGEVNVYAGTDNANIDIETKTFFDVPDFNDRDGWKPIKTLLTMLAKGVNPSEFYIDEDGNTFEVSVKKVKF